MTLSDKFSKQNALLRFLFHKVLMMLQINEYMLLIQSVYGHLLQISLKYITV